MFLVLAKWTGFFSLSKILTKKGLRILCYHNFSANDVVNWRPKLFTKPDTLRKRMGYLKKSGYNVVDLDTALKKLEKGTLPDFPVVITIDDGWHGIMEYAHPILCENDFPYTIYVTTYYSSKPFPVFNLVIAYLFHKTSKRKIDLSELNIPEIGTSYVDILEDENKNLIIKGIIELAEKGDISLRQNLIKRISDILDVNVANILERKIFQIMQPVDLKFLADQGVDLQLHTHRHRWPIQETEAMEELALNREHLFSIQNKKSEHFCYPSGFYTEEQFSFLKKAKIKSATTCEPGLNFVSANYYALKRFLDGENIAQIEFEAELSGFLFLLREVRNRMGVKQTGG